MEHETNATLKTNMAHANTHTRTHARTHTHTQAAGGHVLPFIVGIAALVNDPLVEQRLRFRDHIFAQS